MSVMTFLTTNTPTSTPFLLESSTACGTGCECGYSLYQGSGPLIGPVNIPGPVRAKRSLSAENECLNNKAAIYRFIIQDRNGGSPYVYIGKASNLKSRFCDYVEMTRRLLALYNGLAVWTDGNGFRFIHYEIADALINDRQVTFEFFIPSEKLSKQALSRLEQLEISHAVMQHYNNKCYDEKLLNAMDGLHSEEHDGLPSQWQDVRNHLKNHKRAKFPDSPR